MKIKFFLVMIVIMIFLGLQIPQFFNQKTQLIFCDVGEGDGAILMTPQNVFLIDAGRDSRMAQCLERHLPFWKKDLTGVILTHPDADHINGLKSVIKSYKVKYLFSNFIPNKTGEYRALYDALVNSGVIVKSFVKGEKIIVGNKGERGNRGNWEEIKIESMWPLNEHKEYESTNLFSTISVISIGESKFLMLADAEIASQIQLLPEIMNICRGRPPGRPANGQAGRPVPTKNNNYFSAIKLSHHGSSKNFSYTLIREIQPKYAVISVGTNKYGHPGKKVLEVINKVVTGHCPVTTNNGKRTGDCLENKIEILRTDKIGDIAFECEKECKLK